MIGFKDTDPSEEFGGSLPDGSIVLSEMVFRSFHELTANLDQGFNAVPGS